MVTTERMASLREAPAFTPMNPLVTPLLTDMYQISMTYAHWKNGRVNEHSTFDLFFRKNPFKGQFTVFAGLEEVLRFVHSFRFTDSDCEYLKTIMFGCDPAFFVWLRQLDCRQVKLYSLKEGTICFPKEPLLRVEGPLGICQLLETNLLTLINYPSLLSTNALRIRIAAGEKCELLEFGLRRAQGPDGGLSASKYAVIGGFDGTSNVMAGNLYGIPVKGTHAHAYVMSYLSLSSLNSTTLARKGDPTATQLEFVSVVLEKRNLLYGDAASQCNDSELAAFISYAQAFPDSLLALVDTYDTLKSGVPNFISVGMALLDFGYKPVGIRLDSGDLAYLSRQTKRLFMEADAKLLLGRAGADGDNVNVNVNVSKVPVFENCKIVASNDLDEQTIYSLIQQGHEITTFGVGTNLVTCKKQPALGCVYKLVEISGEPRIKLSEDIEKVVIPARKNVYRLTGANGHPLIDILQRVDESPPEAGKKILCRHPFEEAKRANVTPVKVEALLQLVYDGGEVVCKPLPSIMEIRAFVMEQVKAMRPDHMRAVNPTPYKVSASEPLYEYIHRLWLANAPIAEIT